MKLTRSMYINQPMKSDNLYTLSLRVYCCLAIGFSTALTCSQTMAETQEPSYSIEQKDGDFEIRLYNPLIVAEVITNGDRGSAITSGFRLLADFIFGNNHLPNNKIETSQSAQNKGGKISMTVPVTQQPITQQPIMQQPMMQQQPAMMQQQPFAYNPAYPPGPPYPIFQQQNYQPFLGQPQPQNIQKPSLDTSNNITRVVEGIVTVNPRVTR